ncbi:acetoacetyl-CoA reductase [Methylohalomonas lacus]|uniref:Acetoacetyl-CoA reductase n=1 Tax=Methylohalomonas lacus TaxID=398773 RepID=A0AAE3HIN2_9GAMM|nr:acetoacetyl-CoA reductase [Methylohalomonas lacus]MCS3903051.1 acetoacetyl-CoA reductase [Methylohalomonas lacus]
MEVTLKGKVALVTGGTRGIGSAIVKQFAASGATVATNYRNQEQAEKFQAEMKKAGVDIHIYQADVSDFDACKQLIETVEKDLGPIDILVNNAGVTQDTTLRKMTKDQWDTVMRINLDSVYNMSRNVIEGMLERGSGRIINISSINGQKGQMGQSNYAASKAGMHGFTMALAQEVARKGITVNTVSPGYIGTDMVMAVPEETRNKIIAQIPVSRLGKPEEVADLVTFIASDKAGFITGADISANGGQHMM